MLDQLRVTPAVCDSAGSTTALALIEPYGLDQMYVIKGHLFINTSIDKTWIILKPMDNEYCSFGIDKTIILTYNLT